MVWNRSIDAISYPMQYPILTYGVWASGLIPIAYLSMSDAHKSKEVRFAVPFIWLTAFASLYEPIVTTWLKVNAYFWFTVFGFMEFFCIHLFFKRAFGGRYKKMLTVFLVVFSAAYVAVVARAFIVWEFPSMFPFTLLTVAFIVLCAVLWFKDVFSDMNIESLWQSPTFYFISCFLLVYLGSFSFFGMFDLSTFSLQEVLKFAIIPVMFTYLQNLMLIIGIWKGQHQLSR